MVGAVVVREQRRLGQKLVFEGLIREKETNSTGLGQSAVLRCVGLLVVRRIWHVGRLGNRGGKRVSLSRSQGFRRTWSAQLAEQRLTTCGYC